MITVKTEVNLGGTTRRKRVVCDVTEMPGRLPRITRLMALAIRFDELLRTGKVRDLYHLATIGNVSQARISQILSLVLLAPTSRNRFSFSHVSPKANLRSPKRFSGRWSCWRTGMNNVKRGYAWVSVSGRTENDVRVVRLTKTFLAGVDHTCHGPCV